jgi:hypothetical protein
MSTLYRGPSKDASHQISIHLDKQLQRRGQTWPPQAILVSDWLISKKIFSETAFAK